MPKRFRPYGSAVDAEAAALGRGRPRAGGELMSDLASAMTVPEIASQVAEAVRELSDLTSDGTGFAGLDDIREVIASLERMGQDLPRLCEQLARILVVQREDRRITPSPGQDPDFWVVEAVRRSRPRARRPTCDRRPDPGPRTSAEAQIAAARASAAYMTSGPSGRCWPPGTWRASEQGTRTDQRKRFSTIPNSVRRRAGRAGGLTLVRTCPALGAGRLAFAGRAAPRRAAAAGRRTGPAP